MLLQEDKMGTSLKKFLMLFAFLFVIFFGCQSDEEGVTSPANKFLGKYKSLEPILVKIKTDYCTSNVEDVATIQWDVNWEVKETATENVLDIVMTYSSHDFQITNSECTFGAGYLPEPSPLFIKGYISGETLTIEYDNQEIGSFNFVENEFVGSMKYSYCIAFCQEIYTDDYSFSIQKL